MYLRAIRNVAELPSTIRRGLRLAAGRLVQIFTSPTERATPVEGLHGPVRRLVQGFGAEAVDCQAW